MAQIEKLQQVFQVWNGLSAEKKQTIWNGAVERLSKIDVSELSIPEQVDVDGGNGAFLAAFGPLAGVIAAQQAAKIASDESSN